MELNDLYRTPTYLSQLCFATVPHVAARRQELSADQGEMFEFKLFLNSNVALSKNVRSGTIDLKNDIELLNDSLPNWWQVRNHRGQAGLLPAWKLRPVQLTPDLIDLRLPGTIRPSSSKYGTLTSPDRRYRESMASMFSYRDRGRPQSFGPMNRISVHDLDSEAVNDVQPVVVYVPTESLEENKPMPVLLLPFCNRPHSRTSTLPLSPRSMHTNEPSHYAESVFGPAASTLSRDHLFCWHPHVANAYKPTIMLDRKSSFIAGKV
ncbi:unnamed protein product [Echinostoma caproni]|uniref:SH3 domain-containing protein n=1 Tax=Echinostoma caproni TaxID=27848 RepID=A0A183ANN7_9TREM|nr:unnamed protein product [Echinostoma caproni]